MPKCCATTRRLSFSKVTASAITAYIPANLLERPATLSIRVRSEGLLSESLPFTILPVAEITSFSPASVHAGAGAFTLTVDGTNFSEGAVVRWGSQSLATTFVSSTRLTAAVDAALIASPGTAPVSVMSLGMVSASVPFPVQGDVSISGLTPAAALAESPAFTLTVDGAGFTTATVIQWQGQNLLTTFVSPTRVTAAVSAGQLAAPAHIAITATTGNSVSAPVTFEVSRIPVLSSLERTTVTAGATSFAVAALGSGFVPGAVIRWNGTPLSTTFTDWTKVWAAVPTAYLLMPGTFQVVVVNPGGYTSSPRTVTIEEALPQVTATEPTWVPTGSAALITIRGANFLPASVAKLSGQALATSYLGPDTLTASIPASLLATDGRVPVTVLNPNGRESAAFLLAVVDGGAMLRFSKTLVEYSYRSGGLVPAWQTVRLESSDNSVVPFHFANDGQCPWLWPVASTSFTPINIELRIANPATMAQGSYACDLRAISDADGTAARMTVKLTVQPRALEAQPASLAFTLGPGDAGMKTLRVGGFLSSFTASVTGTDWLTVTPPHGLEQAELTVRATAAGLSAGSYTASVRIASSSEELLVPVTLLVSDSPRLTVAPSALLFTGAAPAAQVLSLLTTASATFQTEVEGPLTLTEGPGEHNVSVSPVLDGLEAGSVVNAAVIVRSADTAPNEVRVPVEIRVPGGPSSIRVNPESLTFNVGQGGAVATAALEIINDGAPVDIQARAVEPWLSVSAGLVSVDPSKITAAGEWTGSIELAASDDSWKHTVPVTVNLTELPLLLLSRNQARFTVVEGGPAPAAESVGISLQGAGAATWMGQAGVDGDTGWLSFGPGSGSTPTTGTLTVDAAQLTAGEYHGTVTVFAPKTANVRERIAVTLTVLPKGSAPAPALAASAVFVTGGSGVVSQNVAVNVVAETPYVSAAVADDGGSWCRIAPSSGVIAPGGSLAVEVDFTGLAPGVHRCSLRVLFGDGTVSILAVAALADGGDCGQTVALLRSPGEGFLVRSGDPQNVEVELRNACGSAIDRAGVALHFSNSDAPQMLAPAGDGLYRGTWIPRNPAPRVVIEMEGTRVAGTVAAAPE